MFIAVAKHRFVY